MCMYVIGKGPVYLFCRYTFCQLTCS